MCIELEINIKGISYKGFINNFTGTPQQMDNWCWAATIFNSYRYENNKKYACQCNIISDDCCIFKNGCDKLGDTYNGLKPLGYKLIDIQNFSTIKFDEIRKYIKNGNLVILIYDVGSANHVKTIFSYAYKMTNTNLEYVYNIYNTYPKNTGQNYWSSQDNLAKGVSKIIVKKTNVLYKMTMLWKNQFLKFKERLS